MASPKIPFSKTDPARVSYRKEKDAYRIREGIIADRAGASAYKNFDLGSDERTARDRAEKIRLLWAEQQAKGLTEWTAEALEVAEAIRTGRNRLLLEPSPPTGLGVDGVFPYDMSASIDAGRAEQRANGLIPVIVRAVPGRRGSGPSLHEAIGACSKYFRETILAAPVEGQEPQVSAWGKTFSYEVERLKDSYEDIALADVGWSVIDAMTRYWSNRPVKKGTSVPIKITTVRNQLKALRRFLKWCHREYDWQPPHFFEDATRKSPKLTDEEKSARKNKSRVKTFTADEVSVLYQYATPFERLLLLLAVCVGYGAAEITTLQLDDLHLADADDGDSYIKRIRGKGIVYGEHWVCPELMKALQWALSRRQRQTVSAAGRSISAKPESKLVLRESGEPLCKLTKSGNISNKAAGVFNTGLLKRIVKDHPDFPKLSFGKLRKTGANWIRMASSGEMATLFLIHGNSQSSDEFLPNYTDENFEGLFKVQKQVYEQRLMPMFALVQEPFPVEAATGGPRISLAKADMIAAMLAAGQRPEAIAAACKVGRATVYRYMRKSEGSQEAVRLL